MYTAWYSARGDTGMHHHQMGQLYHHGPPMIKTEAGVNSDCMMAVDYAPPIKKAGASSAFVWSGGGGQDQGGGGQGGGGVATGSTGVGGNASQGLVHWMSVMAEHMGAGGAHDPSHYALPPWNGASVDHCGQQKELEYSAWPRPRNTMGMKQGYEAKMSTPDGLGGMGHQKVDDRLSGIPGHHQAMSQMLYGAAGLGPGRSGSSSSSPVSGGVSGPGMGSSLLVVPQPLGAGGGGCGGGGGKGKPGGGGGMMPHAHARKYHCKMCPQVGGGPGTGDRRGRKKHISNSPSEFRAPRGATDPLEWRMLESSDHEVFGSKADLQLHTQIHLREAKPYRCTQCPKAFANSSYLAQHSRIHLGIKPYRCEICQRKFTQLSHLQQHIRTHTGDKPYRCTVIGCTKAFSQLSNLQSHSRCHQTDKPFKCNSCYKCFSQEKELLEHIPKHKESKHLKTHICQYCGKSYTQETYLSKHMSKHAERADKRPPITALGLAGLNRSLGQPAPAPFADHPYWPKISPDSAAHLSEAMAQAHQAQEANANGYQQAQQPRDNQNGDDQEAEQNHHRGFSHHRLNGESGENLVIGRPPSNLPLHLNGGHPASSGTPLSAAAPASSAFTPINSVAPHLNGLHHSQLPQRPYLAYDAFPQSKQHQSLPPTNSFPNQLISLHQIRNYAPGGNLLSSDHFLGHTLGLKDKQ